MSILERLIIWGVLVGVAIGGLIAAKEHYIGVGYESRIAEERAEALRIGGQRQAVSTDVDTKHAAAAERTRTIIKTITKEVPIYVSTNDCPMSPGFRVLHDAAAAGELPDPARIADAAAVPAPAVAETLVANYGACTENAQRMSDLQDWVRRQQAVH